MFNNKWLDNQKKQRLSDNMWLVIDIHAFDWLSSSMLVDLSCCLCFSMMPPPTPPPPATPTPTPTLPLYMVDIQLTHADRLINH